MNELTQKKSQPLACVHCGRVFKNYQALVGHLQYCPNRILKRTFEVGDYRFLVFLNPRHRTIRSLRQIENEHPKNEKLFLGALMGLHNAKMIHKFEIEAKDVSSSNQSSIDVS